MSRKHQEYTGFGTGIGQLAGFILIGLLALVALSGAIAGIRFVIDWL